MAKPTKGYQPPTQQEIAACAHSIYEKEGRPNGRDTQHWLQAESQLIAERKAQQGEPTPPTARSDGWSAPPRAQQPVATRN